MKHYRLLAVCLCAVIWLAACQEYNVREGSYAPVNIRDPNLPATQIRWNNVSLLDGDIANKLLVEATNSRRTPTGTLEVWAILRNRTDYSLQLEARASFYDASQAPLEASTAWERLYVPPNATVHFKALSTRVEVGYYNIEVREGR